MTSEQTLTITCPAGAEAVRGLCGGAVHLPGDPGYDAARSPWAIVVDQRPAAVAYPTTAAEVVEVVRAAAAAGLRVAPQGTGHNAGPLRDLERAVLVRTGAMRGVTVDVDTRTARVESGALWEDVVNAVAPHGLAALHGSSPDVGVAGYSLGGGMGWYARELGLAANSITAIELVTADGRLVRATAHQEPDLFWALRGGGGNFGVVTALDLRLFPIDTVYAGMLVWDRSEADRVLRTWARWAADAPDAVTTSFRVLQLPPFEQIPAPVRGRQLVMIDGAVLADDETAAEILAELRALEPEMDTFARVPSASIIWLHMDPEGPTPGVSATTVLGSLPDEGIDAFLGQVGHGTNQSLLSAELRQLGGAVARPAEEAGAVAMVEGAFLLFGVAVAATPEMAAAGEADAAALVSAMTPWANGKQYLNFVEAAQDASNGYTAESWTRPQAVRAKVDAHGLFLSNHQVPTGSPAPLRCPTSAERPDSRRLRRPDERSFAT
ncbi:MAG TPA: FAD-binding oxidoreductase [Actinomycetes bacterium]|nr:FAD-binding oxidoreductase [Actinomycetes bacterium]